MEVVGSRMQRVPVSGGKVHRDVESAPSYNLDKESMQHTRK